MVEYRVLGPLEVAEYGRLIDLGSPRQQMVLALLLSTPNRVLSRDRLIAEIWGERAPDGAKHSLQTYISNLRRILPATIETKRPGYVIHVAAGELDSLVLEQAVGGDLATLRDALGLWRGEPYAGLADESSMLRAGAARLEELHLSLSQARIDADIVAGRHVELVAELETLTERHPMREQFWASLMTALYRSGRQADALRAYQRARGILTEQLGIEPSSELQLLEHRILQHATELGWQQHDPVPPTNLPTPISSFVGRDDALVELTKLLDGSRLVTVTGAGGSGKSRLASELGASVLDRFGDGVWLIPVGPLTDGSLVATEMLGVMGLDAPARQTHLDALVDQLVGHACLLIVDNCEHLLADVAEVVVSVLHGASGVKVLATSRQPLGVAGETVWQLPPLSLPALADPARVEAMSSPAVRLFIDRATDAAPGFRIDDADIGPLVDLCRRLDGLPLAIELVAARAGVLGVDHAHRQLRDRLTRLTSRDPTAPERHQTLLDSVEWSYRLLSDAEKALYVRLAAFAGGFAPDSAIAVGECAACDAREIPDLLSSLVEHTLVTVEPSDAGLRCRMLETIRDHARAKLEESGQGDAARDALLGWVADLAATASVGLAGPHEAEWITRLQIEHDNIRTSLAWALENDPVVGLSVTSSMAQFWFTHSLGGPSTSARTTSYLREGHDWSQRMIHAAADAPAELRAQALVSLGGPLQIRLGQFDDARANLRAAEQLLATLDQPGLEGWAVHYQGIAAWGSQRWDTTVELFRRALRLFTEAEDRRGMLFANMLLGLALIQGQDDGADEGVRRMSRFDEAARASQMPVLVAHAAYGTALVDLVTERERDTVASRLSEAIVLLDDLSNVGCLSHTLQAAALYHAKQGDLERAARTAASASGLRDRLAMVFAPYCGFWPDVDLTALDPDLQARAVDIGHSYSYEEAVQHALEGLAAG